MADKPKLVGPDGNVPGSQRALHTAMTDKAKLQMNKTATEGRVAELVVAGVSAGIQNLRDYIVEENTRLFEEQEQIVVNRVMAEIRRRSIRGRLEARWLVAKEYVRGWLIELGAADPTEKPGHIKLDSSAMKDLTEGPVATEFRKGVADAKT